MYQGVVLSSPQQRTGEWQVFVTPAQRNEYQIWPALARTALLHDDAAATDDGYDDIHDARDEKMTKYSKITIPSAVIIEPIAIYKQLLTQKCSDSISVNADGMLLVERYKFGNKCACRQKRRNSDGKCNREEEDRGILWNHVSSIKRR